MQAKCAVFRSFENRAGGADARVMRTRHISFHLYWAVFFVVGRHSLRLWLNHHNHHEIESTKGKKNLWILSPLVIWNRNAYKTSQAGQGILTTWQTLTTRWSKHLQKPLIQLVINVTTPFNPHQNSKNIKQTPRTNASTSSRTILVNTAMLHLKARRVCKGTCSATKAFVYWYRS